MCCCGEVGLLLGLCLGGVTGCQEGGAMTNWERSSFGRAGVVCVPWEAAEVSCGTR